MNWTSKPITLLLGVSLTGVCLGLFYYFYKKDEEDVNVSVNLRDRKNVTIEIKVSRQLVPAVIGRAGATIKDVEQRTSTRIRFVDDDLTQPDRICVIRGPPEHVRLAEALINDIISSQPVIETYEMYIPQRICSILLADRGEVINALQTSTKAKLILEKGRFDRDAKRRIIIKGSAEQIAAALYHIEDMVQQVNSTDEQLKVNQSSRSPRGKIPSRNAVTNSQETPATIINEDSSAFQQNKPMEVYVSASHSPSQFWVQAVGPNVLDLDELVVEMTNYYKNKENQELHVLKSIEVGQTVAAKFSFDNCWYRAEVLFCLDNEQYEVYFLDYGDNEIINHKDILELRTDFLSLRLQAIECCLANVKPVDEEWSEETCQRFANLSWCAEWKVLTAIVRGYKERISCQGTSRREGSPIPCVDLYDKNSNQEINIGKQLVMENLAEHEEGRWSSASSTLSLSKRTTDSPLNPTALPSTPVSSVGQTSTNLNDQTPKRAPRVIEEIDLTTPKRSIAPVVVDEIDLVTPKHNHSKQFIDNEKKFYENGSGDYQSNNGEYNVVSPTWERKSHGVAAGAETYEEDSDELEIF